LTHARAVSREKFEIVASLFLIPIISVKSTQKVRYLYKFPSGGASPFKINPRAVHILLHTIVRDASTIARDDATARGRRAPAAVRDGCFAWR
jgi:hypothetical protein